MRLNLLLVLCSLYLLLPLAYAQENIVIEEIGTVPKDLIEGMSVQLFANISNRGNTSAEIDLEFRLDSTIMEKQKGIKLEQGTSLKIFSDNYSVVSLSNNKIETIVYFSDSFREIGRKNAQIVVNKKISPEPEKNNFIPWALEFVGPIILLFVGIILLFYIFVLRKRETAEKKKIKEEIPEILLEESAKQPIPKAQSQEIASMISNDIRFFSSKLSEEYGQEEDYELLSNYISNIASIIENIDKNNHEGAQVGLKNFKKGTINLISKFEEAHKSTVLPTKAQISKLKDSREVATKELVIELDRQKVEAKSKKQFIDVLIPDFLLKIAEEKMHAGDIKAAEGLISGAKKLFENEEVVQRLRKLREIGF